MPKFEDLTGVKFGGLTVLKRVVKDSKKTYWECQCECGDIKVSRSDSLKNKITTHCGCKDNSSKKHGMTNTRLFNIWSGMRDRCNNQNSKSYKDYGDRGVKICREWSGENGFINFYNWSINNGYEKDLTIDRIDVNGNYEPNNCRWVDMKTQCNNRRNNFNININGEVKSISEWSKISGVHRETIYQRIEKGVTGNDLLNPVEKKIATRQSGVKNVKWDKSKNRWKVDFNIKGKVKHIGTFKELDDAIKAKEEYLKSIAL